MTALIKAEGEERYKTGILEEYDGETIVIDGEKIKLSKCLKVNFEPDELEDAEALEESEDFEYLGDTDGETDGDSVSEDNED